MSRTDTRAAELRYNVDYFALKNGLVYAHGWVLHPQHAITTVALRGCTADGTEPFALESRYPVDRPDLGRQFSHIPHARQSGFHCLGRVDGPAPDGVGLQLRIVFADGQACVVPVHGQARLGRPGSDRRRIVRYAISRGLAMIRQGSFSLLRKKIRRLLQAPPIVRRNPVRISEVLHGRAVVLVLDHNLGGGANLYRERFIDRQLAADRGVVLLTFSPLSLAYNLIAQTAQQRVAVTIDALDDLLPLLQGSQIREIVYNNAVLFPDAQKVPGLLLMLKHTATASRLTVNIHDFFSLCPSQHLLNDEGAYCDLPEQRVCEQCLARSRQPFLEFYGKLDIGHWRAQWRQVLGMAERIRCFSHNSAQLLLRAYPELPPAAVRVQPHSMSYCQFAPLQAVAPSPMHIGVVGDIGEHKGAGVVNDLAGIIASRRLPYRIVIIGTISELRHPNVLTQTGAFHHHELPDLLRRQGINICLFPSICPETFSFVVHELMQLSLPIASFPFGAQGEAVAAYPKGYLLRGARPEQHLDELVAFHGQIYGVKTA